jgi:photosystem II stability/assembly factor-like uncharacterized protein
MKKFGSMPILLFFLLFEHTAYGRWAQSNSPTSSFLWVTTVAVSGGGVFVGASAGVSRSTDNGDSWTTVNSGLTAPWVQALKRHKGDIIAGSLGGIFISSDNGASWNAVGSGLTETNVLSIEPIGDAVYAGTMNGGVFLSTDNATSWNAARSGIPNTLVLAFAASGNSVFAGTYAGVFRSTDNGASWTVANAGLADTVVPALAVKDGKVFAGTRAGVFVSVDNGAGWTAASTGLTKMNIASFAVIGGNILTGTDSGGIFLSTDNGARWNPIDSGIAKTQYSVSAIAASGDKIFAGIYGNGIWRRPLSEIMEVTAARKQRELPEQRFLKIGSESHSNRSVPVEFAVLRSHAAIDVYDMAGRKIAAIVNRRFDAGAYRFLWNTRLVSRGCYTIILRTDLFTSAKLVQITH